MKGIWFYGLSGSGKTFASKYLSKKIKKSLVLDGDIVRKFISYDLGYTIQDRKEQIRRVFGIAQLFISLGYFPIVSTVYMNKPILKKAKKSSIKIVTIFRDFNQIKNKDIYYKKIANVIGKDIKMPRLKTYKIINTGCQYFQKTLKSLII
jgi:adenylylsulfate kinase-like enzyme